MERREAGFEIPTFNQWLRERGMVERNCYLLAYRKGRYDKAAVSKTRRRKKRVGRPRTGEEAGLEFSSDPEAFADGGEGLSYDEGYSEDYGSDMGALPLSVYYGDSDVNENLSFAETTYNSGATSVASQGALHQVPTEVYSDIELPSRQQVLPISDRFEGSVYAESAPPHTGPVFSDDGTVHDGGNVFWAQGSDGFSHHSSAQWGDSAHSLHQHSVHPSVSSGRSLDEPSQRGSFASQPISHSQSVHLTDSSSLVWTDLNASNDWGSGMYSDRSMNIPGPESVQRGMPSGVTSQVSAQTPPQVSPCPSDDLISAVTPRPSMVYSQASTYSPFAKTDGASEADSVSLASSPKSVPLSQQGTHELPAMVDSTENCEESGPLRDSRMGQGTSPLASLSTPPQTTNNLRAPAVNVVPVLQPAFTASTSVAPTSAAPASATPKPTTQSHSASYTAMNSIPSYDARQSPNAARPENSPTNLGVYSSTEVPRIPANGVPHPLTKLVSQAVPSPVSHISGDFPGPSVPQTQHMPVRFVDVPTVPLFGRSPNGLVPMNAPAHPQMTYSDNHRTIVSMPHHPIDVQPTLVPDSSGQPVQANLPNGGPFAAPHTDGPYFSTGCAVPVAGSSVGQNSQIPSSSPSHDPTPMCHGVASNTDERTIQPPPQQQQQHLIQSPLQPQTLHQAHPLQTYWCPLPSNVPPANLSPGPIPFQSSGHTSSQCVPTGAHMAAGNNFLISQGLAVPVQSIEASPQHEICSKTDSCHIHPNSALLNDGSGGNLRERLDQVLRPTKTATLPRRANILSRSVPASPRRTFVAELNAQAQSARADYVMENERARLKERFSLDGLSKQSSKEPQHFTRMVPSSSRTDVGPNKIKTISSASAPVSAKQKPLSARPTSYTARRYHGSSVPNLGMPNHSCSAQTDAPMQVQNRRLAEPIHPAVSTPEFARLRETDGPTNHFVLPSQQRVHHPVARTAPATPRGQSAGGSQTGLQPSGTVGVRPLSATNTRRLDALDLQRSPVPRVTISPPPSAPLAHSGPVSASRPSTAPPTRLGPVNTSSETVLGLPHPAGVYLHSSQTQQFPQNRAATSREHQQQVYPGATRLSQSVPVSPRQTLRDAPSPVHSMPGGVRTSPPRQSNSRNAPTPTRFVQTHQSAPAPPIKAPLSSRVLISRLQEPETLVRKKGISGSHRPQRSVSVSARPTRAPHSLSPRRALSVPVSPRRTRSPGRAPASQTLSPASSDSSLAGPRRVRGSVTRAPLKQRPSSSQSARTHVAKRKGSLRTNVSPSHLRRLSGIVSAPVSPRGRTLEGTQSGRQVSGLSMPTSASVPVVNSGPSPQVPSLNLQLVQQPGNASSFPSARSVVSDGTISSYRLWSAPSSGGTQSEQPRSVASTPRSATRSGPGAEDCQTHFIGNCNRSDAALSSPSITTTDWMENWIPVANTATASSIGWPSTRSASASMSANVSPRIHTVNTTSQPSVAGSARTNDDERLDGGETVDEKSQGQGVSGSPCEGVLETPRSIATEDYVARKPEYPECETEGGTLASSSMGVENQVGHGVGTWTSRSFDTESQSGRVGGNLFSSRSVGTESQAGTLPPKSVTAENRTGRTSGTSRSLSVGIESRSGLRSGGSTSRSAATKNQIERRIEGPMTLRSGSSETARSVSTGNNNGPHRISDSVACSEAGSARTISDPARNFLPKQTDIADLETPRYYRDEVDNDVPKNDMEDLEGLRVSVEKLEADALAAIEEAQKHVTIASRATAHHLWREAASGLATALGISDASWLRRPMAVFPPSSDMNKLSAPPERASSIPEVKGNSDNLRHSPVGENNLAQSQEHAAHVATLRHELDAQRRALEESRRKLDELQHKQPHDSSSAQFSTGVVSSLATSQGEPEAGKVLHGNIRQTSESPSNRTTRSILDHNLSQSRLGHISPIDPITGSDNTHYKGEHRNQDFCNSIAVQTSECSYCGSPRHASKPPSYSTPCAPSHYSEASCASEGLSGHRSCRTSHGTVSSVRGMEDSNEGYGHGGCENDGNQEIQTARSHVSSWTDITGNMTSVSERASVSDLPEVSENHTATMIDSANSSSHTDRLREYIRSESGISRIPKDDSSARTVEGRGSASEDMVPRVSGSSRSQTGADQPRSSIQNGSNAGGGSQVRPKQETDTGSACTSVLRDEYPPSRVDRGNSSEGGSGTTESGPRRFPPSTRSRALLQHARRQAASHSSSQAGARSSSASGLSGRPTHFPKTVPSAYPRNSSASSTVGNWQEGEPRSAHSRNPRAIRGPARPLSVSSSWGWGGVHRESSYAPSDMSSDSVQSAATPSRAAQHDVVAADDVEVQTTASREIGAVDPQTSFLAQTLEAQYAKLADVLKGSIHGLEETIQSFCAAGPQQTSVQKGPTQSRPASIERDLRRITDALQRRQDRMLPKKKYLSQPYSPQPRSPQPYRIQLLESCPSVSDKGVGVAQYSAADVSQFQSWWPLATAFQGESSPSRSPSRRRLSKFGKAAARKLASWIHQRLRHPVSQHAPPEVHGLFFEVEIDDYMEPLDGARPCVDMWVESAQDTIYLGSLEVPCDGSDGGLPFITMSQIVQDTHTPEGEAWERRFVRLWTAENENIVTAAHCVVSSAMKR